jgi:hypothetical protein
MAAVETPPEQAHRYVVEVPPELSREEWIRKYSPQPAITPKLN